MENNKYWFFGSKLNTALLLVLIILTVIAIRIMLKDKETYFPTIKDEGKMTVCPDLKISSRMPGAFSEIYIYNGERKKISDFNTTWVKQNCLVKEEVVY